MIDGKPNPQHELFKRWCSMRNQCDNEHNANYYCYGGRGITYIKRWKDFSTFVEDIEEAIGPLPYKGAHLDRKNNDGDFKPSNMMWSTPKENYNNRRTNHYIKFRGKTQSLADWSRESGVAFRTLYSRLERGYTVMDALTLKPFQKPVKLKHR